MIDEGFDGVDGWGSLDFTIGFSFGIGLFFLIFGMVKFSTWLMIRDSNSSSPFGQSLKPYKLSESLFNFVVGGVFMVQTWVLWSLPDQTMSAGRQHALQALVFVFGLIAVWYGVKMVRAAWVEYSGGVGFFRWHYQWWQRRRSHKGRRGPWV